MRRIRAGLSPPTAATSSPRNSSAWAPDRCTCRNCRAFQASSPSRAIRSTPAAGITITPVVTPRVRRWTGLPTSVSASSAPARPPYSACRIWPAPARNSTFSSARRLPSTSAPTRRSIPTGFDHRIVRLAAALAGEFYREPGRRQRRRRSGSGRLDRSVAADPRQDHAIAARAADCAEHARGL